MIALGPVTALVLAGCGGSSSSTPQGSGAPTSSSTTATDGSSGTSDNTYPSTAAGVRLTAPGSELKLGQTARMTWKPDQKTVGVVAISVTKLQKMSIRAFSDWTLNRATRRSTPYFVHATVRNLGHSNLSGKPVPLYLLDQRNTLLEASTFRAKYAPCPSRPLPAKFEKGKKTSVCLVYFAPHHGKLVAISFRPDQTFDAITWKGQVSSKQGHHHKKHHKKHHH